MIWTLAILVLLAICLAPLVAEWLKPPVDARSRRDATGDFVELSRGLTYYQWYGPSRGPVVVCIHGLSMPGYVFHPLAMRLIRLGYRVLVYDLYGRGMSDRPRGRQDSAFFVSQLEELLDALEVRQGVTLLGYSMGGAVAAAFAVKWPERVDRLVLVASIGLGVSWGRFQRLCIATPLLGGALMRLVGGLRHRRGIDRAATPPEGMPEFYHKLAAETRLRGTLPAILSSQRNIVAEDMEPKHRILAGTALPVLAFWGGQDDAIPGSALGRLAQINRTSRQVQFDTAGHDLPWTKDAEIVDEMLEFLREVPPG